MASNTWAGTNLTASTVVTWPFNLGTAGQTATFSTGTDKLFSVNWVDKGSNLTLKDKATSTYPTGAPVTYTRFQPAAQSASVDATNLVSFNLRPATGMSFTPTSISFDCMRYGTDGGNIDVAWKSSNGTITTIATALKPNRDNNVAGGLHVSYDLSSLSIPASTSDCGLYVYIYNLGNTKQAGLANIVVNGSLTGDTISVTKYSFATSVSPASGGTVACVPVGTTFDEGTSLTVTATRSFGHQFKEWRNAATDAVVSTANPYTFSLNANTALKAVFDTIYTYALSLTTTGAPSYMVAVSPVATVQNGQNMYESGTTVTLTASNNPITTFTNWSTGETNATKTLSMTQDQTISASFSSVDYIVGWDLYKSGGSSRPADFYSSTDNQTAALILRKADGTVNSWLDKSMVAAGGYYNRGAAVNWKPVADQYYYQISFNATDYTDIKVAAGLLYNYNAYTVQKCEYSLDGTTFTQLGTYNLTAGQTWFDNTFTLPADANHAAKVYVRWMPDYTSSMAGTTATANDGTAISNIYVTATAAIYNDGTAPVLASSVPAESATNASTTGKIVLTFDEKVQLTNGTTATLGSKTLTPTVTGTTVTFPYAGLDYNTAYTFTLAGNTVSDLAGNTKTTATTINFTTMTRPVVTKKNFDFVVGVDGDFKAALAAAATASTSGDRFRVFFPNGNYNIGANTGDTNQKTTIAIPNLSLVGQSSDGVVLYNQNTAEGIGVTATMYFTSAANNEYLQDLTLKNKDYRSGVASIGRCVALQDQGTKNIYKNVNVLSNQDTYYSGSGRNYFEGGSLHGTVDFLCGGGDIMFNECLLYLEDRTGCVITAPATASTWGYVFLNCTIDGFSSTNGNYYLGRPWQNSPKSVYINTKMNVLPTAAGWTEMGVVPGLFAEYNSRTTSGTVVDLSSRKTSYTYSGVTTAAPNPVLTATQAAQYTVENVVGGSDAWQPQLYTDQATVPVISASNGTISWADNNYVLCWAVFKNDVFVKFVTTNSYSIPWNATSGVYTVRAANEMGGLSAASNGYSFTASATGFEVPNASSRIVSQSYYTFDGRKLARLKGYQGTVIIRSVYADGHTESTKTIKLHD
jgi:pectin methylesterase-like acyl-CoA thioesterase